VNQYALAFTDGSFENIDVDGTPSEDKIKALTSFQLNNVCGIVFSTENPTTYDKVLEEDYPNCTHGLIVSLADVGDGIMRWQKEQAALVADYQASAGFSSKYVSVSVVRGEKDSSKNTIDQILGYNNTKVIRAYNKQCDDDNKVLPVEAVDAMTVNAPAGTSGWYVPSVKEVSLFRWNGGTVDDTGIPKNVPDVNVTQNLITVLKCLSEVSGLSVSTTFNDNGSSAYWSSSELPSNKNGDKKAYYLDLSEELDKNDKMPLGIHSSDKAASNRYYVRAVCAF
jgi:hypothetical protein